jgi:hypothetical protein
MCPEFLKVKETGWKDIAELIGIVAIVASLIFVGLQLKQSHEIAASQIYQDRTSATVAAITAMMASPELTSGLAKLESDQLDTITAAELVAAGLAISASAYLWDNSHYQYEHGYISAEGWAKIRSDIKGTLRQPFARKMMMEHIEYARPPLAEVYEQVMKELDEERRD